MSKNDHVQKFIRLRMVITGFLFTLVFSAIAVKAVYLQVYRGPWLARKAADQYEMSIKTAGKRGTIYDKYNSEIERVERKILRYSGYNTRRTKPDNSK